MTALPGRDLETLVPRGASAVGELVAEAPRFAEGYLQWHGASVSAEQRAALWELMRAVEAFATQPNFDLYAYDPADKTPAWQAIRSVALRALDAFGWAPETPPQR